EGLIDIDKTPYAEGDDEKSTLDIPGDVLLDANVVNAEAHPGEAAASLEEIDLAPGGGLIDSTVLGVGSVSATCDEGDLSSEVANLEILGNEIPIEAGDDTAIIPSPLDGLVQVERTQHIDNPGGSSTVDALRVSVLDGIGDLALPDVGERAGQTIPVGSATCAQADDGDNGDGDNGDGDNGDGDNGDGDNGDGDNGDGDNGDGDNGDGDNGNGNGNDEANGDGTAPEPEPQPDHIAVTG